MNLRRKVESACSTFSQKGRKLSVVSLMKWLQHHENKSRFIQYYKCLAALIFS